MKNLEALEGTDYYVVVSKDYNTVYYDVSLRTTREVPGQYYVEEEELDCFTVDIHASELQLNNRVREAIEKLQPSLVGTYRGESFDGN